MSKVYVIIPAYNEGQVIKDVLNDVLGKYLNVVCVNDGSKDNTSAEVSKTKAVLVEHPINLGQGAALQTGLEYALQDQAADVFVTYDADGQHQLDDVSKMIKELESGGYDIILGSRFLGAAKDVPPLKKMMLKMAVKFTNATSGVKLTDAHNGLRVFNRKVAEGLKIDNPDMTHASEIIEKIAENKYNYKEMPVTIVYNDYSKAKGQSIFNAVNIGLDILFDRLIK
jgi:glycosyltransferase involved in cell wall biosynthesis